MLLLQIVDVSKMVLFSFYSSQPPIGKILNLKSRGILACLINMQQTEHSYHYQFSSCSVLKRVLPFSDIRYVCKMYVSI